MHPEVIRATPHARARVVETVVAAFATDPAFRYFFRDGGAFDEQAATFAGYLFDKRVTEGTVWVIDGGAAVAMWDAPRAAAADGGTELELPAATLARLEAYESAVHEALPADSHWYLGVVATHPGSAGRRLGRAVMRAGAQSATAAGLPAHLETTNPANVELYRGVGWEVTATAAVDGLSIWVMRHESPKIP
ncbi:GNAT family N-acetyltransferase [Allorhizocola rhizosphaerae]|uniref:GNAT family N-acetyltransferase n=1 Tax=Allorhizocola rhizosphaerae TaxID=1872709 RepID=UPI000E3C1395|nr:GNAT family N-acetyltransferase [Allorhizocola rhizosphaerae]